MSDRDRRPAPIATVLVVDDERSVTEGVAALLRKQPYEVLRAHSAEEALGLLRRCQVDVIISDESMPGTPGSEFLRVAAQNFPHAARILLTGKVSLDVALKAINAAKISRLLQKPCAPDELRDAVAEAVRSAVAASAAQRLLQVVRSERANEQQASVDQHRDDPRSVNAARRFGALDSAALSELSPRELEVLELILDGQRLPQVAKALFISPHTARNHLKAIFEKLDVHSQEELLARGRGFPAAHDPENGPH